MVDPVEQEKHSVEPREIEYLPEGQTKQIDSPELIEYAPEMQGIQCVELIFGTSPALHFQHSDMRGAGAYDPGRHVEQNEEPVVELNRPAEQFLQLEDCSRSEKVPISQTVQKEPLSCEKRPSEQMEQNVALS